MTKRLLNGLSRRYARAMNPNAYVRGAMVALGAGAVTYGFGMASMAAQAYDISKSSGVSFHTSWNNVRSEYGNNWRNGTIGLIVAGYLLMAVVPLGLSKSESKRYAEFIVKRYLHDLRIDMKNTDNLMYRDIANLLLANMSDAERKDILDMGVQVGKALEQNDALTLYGQLSSAQGKAKRNALLVESKNILSRTIDSVIARNPGLEQLIFDILDGKTYYNPRMFNQKQR